MTGRGERPCAAIMRADPAAAEEPRINFTTRIPANLRRRFKAACVERGVSMETAVAEALGGWIGADHQ